MVSVAPDDTIIRKLFPTTVANAKPKDRDYKLSDGKGLYLLVKSKRSQALATQLSLSRQAADSLVRRLAGGRPRPGEAGFGGDVRNWVVRRMTALGMTRRILTVLCLRLPAASMQVSSLD
jgi:hypothetical protein